MPCIVSYMIVKSDHVGCMNEQMNEWMGELESEGVGGLQWWKVEAEVGYCEGSRKEQRRAEGSRGEASTETGRG